MIAVVEKHALGALTKIAKGGQGSIYLAPEVDLPGEPSPMVYKEYTSEILKRDGAAIRNGMPQLLEIPDELGSVERNTLFKVAVWPRALVTTNGDAAGILIRKIKKPFYFNMRLPAGSKEVLLEALNFLRPDEDQRLFGVPEVSQRQLAIFVARVALTLDFFHQHGLVVGDFSPKNIAVTNPSRFREELHPKFMDIDSFRLSGGVPPLDQGSTPGWFAPETKMAEDEVVKLRSAKASISAIARASSRAKILSKATDVFKFGLFAMRMFDPGDRFSAYVMKEETEVTMRKIFGARFDVLAACLDEVPTNRPGAAELAKLFRR